METLGAFLKSHRETKGIRLEEIASITKIHLKSLQLLEADRWSDLPPDPFLRGFLVAYGAYVGLDAKELVARYRDEVLKHEPDETPPLAPPVATPPADAKEHSTFVSSKNLMGAMSVAGVLVVLGTIVYLGKRATDQSFEKAKVAEVAPEKPTVAAIEPTPEKKVEEKLAPAPTPNHEVVIEGNERTWVKVVIDTNSPLEYFLPKGERVSYAAQEKIKVVLGNATGSKVTYNGGAVEGTGFMGTIRTYKFPKDADFPQDVPKNRAPTATDTPAPEPEKSE